MSYTVIAGYDGSEPSKHALIAAIQQAQAFDGDLVMVTAHTVGALTQPRIFGGEVRELEETCSEALSHALQSAAAEDLPAQSMVVPAAPAEALVNVANERGASLIVVGNRGEGLISGVLLGSTAYKLIHTSTVPVLIVPAEEPAH